jgi:hypothetical protein
VQRNPFSKHLLSIFGGLIFGGAYIRGGGGAYSRRFMVYLESCSVISTFLLLFCANGNTLRKGQLKIFS